MPNWCNNSLSLVGPTEELKKLQQAFKDGRLFDAILPCPKELADVSADFSKRPELEEKYGHSDWYSFNTAEWGTKWDVGSDDDDHGEIVPIGKDEVTGETARWSIFFDTAWSPAIGIYEKLFEQGFEVYATYYEPGCDFAGIWDDGDDYCITLSDVSDNEFETDGQLIELDNHYGILESRQEYRAMEREEVQEWYEDGVKETGLDI